MTMSRFARLNRWIIGCGILCLSTPLSGAEKTVPTKGEKDKKTDAVKKVTYEDDVQPIFRQHCFSCHHQGEKKGGLALDSFQAMLEGGGSGEIVYDDGDVEGSRLWQLVSHEDTPIMPPNQDRIPDTQLAVLRAWLEGGILENRGSKLKAKKKNPLEFVSAKRGKPDGPAALPETMPLRSPVFTERPAATTAIACSPWAPLVAIAGQKQIVFYHSESGDLLGIVPFEEGIAQSLRFSRDGAFLIAGGGEHSVRGLVAIYDVRSGKRIAQVGDDLDVVLDADATSSLQQVALGGPQRMLRIFDTTSGERLFDLKKHTDWIMSVAYSPDDVLIASGDRSAGLVVWETSTGREYLNLSGHKGSINAITWRSDSNVLASGSEDGTVKLWDVFSGKQIKSINVGGPVTDVAFGHDGQLVTACRNGRATVWKPDGSKVKDLPPAPEAVLEADLSHDGKRVVFGDWNGRIVNVQLDQPDQLQTLAANPPEPSVLEKQFQAQLDEQQGQLASLMPRHEALLSELRKAESAKKDAENRLSSAQKAAQEASETAQQNRSKAEQLAGSIKELSSQSRDLQDELTAIRIGLRDGEKTDQQVANQEIAFGNALIKLAKHRTERLHCLDESTRLLAEAEKHNQSAKAIQGQIPGLEEAVTSARQKFEEVESLRLAAESTLTQIASRLDRVHASLE